MHRNLQWSVGAFKRESLATTTYITSVANLRDARQRLLGVLGEHYIKYKFALTLEKSYIVMDQHLKEASMVR